MSGALSVLCHLSEKVVDFSSKDDNLNLQKKKNAKKGAPLMCIEQSDISTSQRELLVYLVQFH